MDIKLTDYYLFSVPVSFEISRVHIPYSRHVILKLIIDGRIGIGEGVLYHRSIHDTENYLKQFNPNLDFLKFDSGLTEAFDEALLDAEEKIDKSYLPKYTKQVFIEKPKDMFVNILEMINQGTDNIKIKLGRNINNDIELIKRLKLEFPGINFKADVNRGYTAHDFVKILDVGSGFIKIWEEPVITSNQQLLKEIKEKYQIRIMLDESIRSIEDLNKYISLQIIDILNIKLSRVGGISMAKKYVNICREHNVDISIGCNEELGIGMWSINTFAKNVESCVGVEGIGSERLKFDIVQKNFFSEKELFKASEINHFSVFTKKNKMMILDLVKELKENYLAKCRNFLILCKII